MSRLFLIILSTLLVGCSIAYTTKQEVSKNEYIVEAHGNAFSTEDDLLIKIHERAEQLCGKSNYTFNGAYSKKDDWSGYASTGIVFSMGYMKANVYCLEPS
jgi:hypothetical protein